MGRQTQPPAAISGTPATVGPGRTCYSRTEILSPNPGPQSLRNFQIRFARGECSGRCRGAISIGGNRQSRITLEARDLLEKLNVLVTGGAGFIGSHLVDALVERGHRVRVLDALVSQVHGDDAAPTYVNSGAEFIQGDVCDRKVVDAALDGIDVRDTAIRSRERPGNGCFTRRDPRAPAANQKTRGCIVDVDLWRGCLHLRWLWFRCATA